uniref:hypothetical protein n=1 Tax=Hydrocytium acuminatum TaxID=1745963 RepID=UPI002A8259EE|nr:hypothetical protein UYM18_pgp111 [Hydrocytium acuminatum]WOR09509.1 hypothetical protein [Hydrocytium acuminatum]
MDSLSPRYLFEAVRVLKLKIEDKSLNFPEPVKELLKIHTKNNTYESDQVAQIKKLISANKYVEQHADLLVKFYENIIKEEEKLGENFTIAFDIHLINPLPELLKYMNPKDVPSFFNTSSKNKKIILNGTNTTIKYSPKVEVVDNNTF